MATSRYRALLIGNSHYPDDAGNLPDLNGPPNDVSRLASALVGATGLFRPEDVRLLTDRPSHAISSALEETLSEARRDDLVFLYYSGHGLLSDDGSLLLCGRDTRTDLRISTTVSSGTITRVLANCAASTVVIVLDCCYSGAFKAGEVGAELAGRGRFVLTSCRGRERAPDAEHATGLSRFTGHLVRGLEGAAGRPGASALTISELYQYVHKRMTTEGSVIPQSHGRGEGDIVIARAPQPPAFAPAVDGSTAGLALSTERIDLEDVELDEELPVERVYVRARDGSGHPATWTAETDADWVTLSHRHDHLRIELTRLSRTARANVEVRNHATGEIRVLRIVTRARRKAPSPFRLRLDSRDAADAAIEKIAQIADWAEPPMAQRLRDLGRELRSLAFRVIVTGSGQVGKSTLVNALLVSEGQAGPAPVVAGAPTAVLVRVVYAAEPTATAWHFDGSSEPWPLDRYLRESVLAGSWEESQHRLGLIREFEVGYPAQFCQEGMVFYDAPVPDNTSDRLRVTWDAIGHCDAALVVIGTNAPPGQYVTNDLRQLIADGVAVFVVVNVRGSRPADGHLREQVWNEVVRAIRGGPVWAGQELADQDVFLLDAKAAVAARRDGDAPAGLTALEQRLADFLSRKRQPVHLEPMIRQSEQLAAKLAAAIESRMEPRAKLSEARSRLHGVAKIVERRRQDAESEIKYSLFQMVTELRSDLPTHLDGAEFPTRVKAFVVFRPKKRVEEVSRVIQDFLSLRTSEWVRTAPAQVMSDLLTDLAHEVDQYIRQISLAADIPVQFANAPKAGLTDRSAHAPAVERFAQAIALLMWGHLSTTWLVLPSSVAIMSSVAIVAPITRNFEVELTRRLSSLTDEILAEFPARVWPEITRLLGEALEPLEAAAVGEAYKLVDEKIEMLLRLETAQADLAGHRSNLSGILANG